MHNRKSIRQKIVCCCHLLSVKKALTRFWVLWCYERGNRSFNSESSPLFAFKISRLGNYQNLSYKQFSKATQVGNYFCELAVGLNCYALHITPMLVVTPLHAIFLNKPKLIQDLLTLINPD